jgi:transaldolase
MKFFLDTADIDAIREANTLGIVDGVTTNPSLIAKSGKPLALVAREICETVKGPVSLEVVSTETDEMLAEARELAELHPNVVVKLPMIKSGLQALKILSSENIKVNVTLIFSPTQALLAAKNGAFFVSPFIGRLDEISADGMGLIEEVLEIYEAYGFETEVLVASVRHPLHVVEAAKMGADIVTLPPSVLEKLWKHPLTDIGLEKFLADWRKAQSAD